LEGKNIIIVDDDMAILKGLKGILEFEGYSVDTAETGREAIEKSRAKFYDLALLDIKLPDMEGIELLKEIHRETPKMMKIMITGYPSLENAVKALNLGADAYVIKPINPEELLKTVKEKLKEEEEAEKMSEDKMAKWVEARVRKLEQEYNKRKR
jgi:DNA-binding NtrC family response regulator